MTQLLYYGDAQMFRKLKQLYETPTGETFSDKKKLKKKKCLENISFMFKENHFQFPPKSKKHGLKSQCGTNVLFSMLRVSKNVIGVLTWNGDEYFPSQTLTLFDLNRTDSIVHVLELSEDEIIGEKIIDFQIGDDFVVCQTDSCELYFIGFYQSSANRGMNYHCEKIPCEKFGKAEWIKICWNKILIKSASQRFFIAKVQRYDQVPTFKPIENVLNNATYSNVKDAYFGELFDTVLTETDQIYSMGRFIATNDRWGIDWIGEGPAILPTGVTNIEKLINDNHSILIKDENPNANHKYYMYHPLSKSLTDISLEQLIGKSFPNETFSIEEIIPNPTGIGYIVLITFSSGSKRLIFIGHSKEESILREYLEPLDVDGLLHIHDFPSYFYSVTGFDKEFVKCHLTNNFFLFQVEQSQNTTFFNKLVKNTKYLDIEVITKNDTGEQNQL